MARIAGIDLPKYKRGVIGLTYIFGIGKSRAKEILQRAQVNEDKKVNEWNDDEISNRGIRHRAGLPLRGQKTKNNSRTRKGRRKTVANKKKATK